MLTHSASAVENSHNSSQNVQAAQVGLVKLMACLFCLHYIVQLRQGQYRWLI